MSYDQDAVRGSQAKRSQLCHGCIPFNTTCKCSLARRPDMYWVHEVLLHWKIRFAPLLERVAGSSCTWEYSCCISHVSRCDLENYFNYVTVKLFGI